MLPQKDFSVSVVIVTVWHGQNKILLHVIGYQDDGWRQQRLSQKFTYLQLEALWKKEQLHYALSSCGQGPWRDKQGEQITAVCEETLK